MELLDELVQESRGRRGRLAIRPRRISRFVTYVFDVLSSSSFGEAGQACSPLGRGIAFLLTPFAAVAAVEGSQRRAAIALSKIAFAHLVGSERKASPDATVRERE